MPRIKDLTGQKFQKLLVIEKSKFIDSSRSIKWKCLCDCGNYAYVNGTTLKAHKQKSCGCANKEKSAKIKHGNTINNKPSKTYNSWSSMKQRCTNKNNPKYKNYGERGIDICDRWINSFENFLNDMGEKPENLTLERIDVNKGYSKENCCWANSKTQANNKTNNNFITYKGLTLTVSEWADKLKIPFLTLRMRLHRNWSIERAFNNDN